MLSKDTHPPVYSPVSVLSRIIGLSRTSWCPISNEAVEISNLAALNKASYKIRLTFIIFSLFIDVAITFLQKKNLFDQNIYFLWYIKSFSFLFTDDYNLSSLSFYRSFWRETCIFWGSGLSWRDYRIHLSLVVFIIYSCFGSRKYMVQIYFQSLWQNRCELHTWHFVTTVSFVTV